MVEVQEGMSISIPCQYESQHKDRDKYFYYYHYDEELWKYWYPIVNTNSQANSGIFSILDDKTQRVITVIMRDVSVEYTCLYGCGVTYYGSLDDYEDIFVSVTKGMLI